MRNKIVALVDAIKKRGRDSIIAVRLGVFESVAEAERITVFFATGSELASNIATKFIEAVDVVKLELNFDELGIFFQAITASLVLGVRVDIRIIPVKRRLNPLLTESLDAIHAARRTTGME